MGPFFKTIVTAKMSQFSFGIEIESSFLKFETVQSKAGAQLSLTKVCVLYREPSKFCVRKLRTRSAIRGGGHFSLQS